MSGYAAASAVSLAVMGIDKWLAKAGAVRVPEKTLHALELAGGWPGSIAAMLLFRHKTSKPGFYMVTIGAAVLHAAVWASWLWLR